MIDARDAGSAAVPEDRAGLLADLVAGVITATLLVPQAIAFAALAGLPPAAGLYASVVPVFVYAALGSSRTLAVGPVSVASLMVAHALATPGLSASPLANAAALALMGGVFLLVLSLLRAGALVNVLSAPVLGGFTTGAALLIIVSQLREFTGLRVVPAGDGWIPALAGAPTTVAITSALGAAGLVAMLLVGPRIAQLGSGSGGRAWIAIAARAMPFAVVVAAAASIGLLDDHLPGHGVRVVGDVPGGLPGLTFDFLFDADWRALAPSAILIALVGFVESVSIAKVFASRRREVVDPDRELLAIGAANVGAAFTGALPVAGGFGRTVVNVAAGARTQWAAVVSGLLVIAVLLADPPIIERIPRAALAAIIIAAVVKLIDLPMLARLWRYDRSEALVYLATALGVVVAGVELGLIGGLVATLVALIAQSRYPHIATVGRIPGTEHYRNVLRHRVETWPGLLLLRVDASLRFANASVIADAIGRRIDASPGTRDVVLIGAGINAIDATGLEMLEALAKQLRAAGIVLHLAEMKGPITDRLARTGFEAALAPGRVFRASEDAVAALAVASGTTVTDEAATVGHSTRHAPTH